jgi:hypothetical protein
MTKTQRLLLLRKLWRDLIDQAKKFIKQKSPWHNTDKARDLMENAIGKNWTTDYDPLCQRYFRKDCAGCPLRKIKQDCAWSGSAWYKVDQSKSWSEFVFNAEKYIISALDKATEYYTMMKKRKKLREVNSCEQPKK